MLIDTPPVVLLPDANLLATMVDGVVLVVSAGTTPYEIVQQAADAIGRERLLGVVLTGPIPETCQASITARYAVRADRWPGTAN